MNSRLVRRFALALQLIFLSTASLLAQAGADSKAQSTRPQGPCDIYAKAGDPCAAAHSTTRALYASYSGPLYQVLRQSDGRTLDISVVQPARSAPTDPGGYADAAAQDAFCANTYCWITTIYDQSPKHNNLIQAPLGGFSGPAMGGANTLPIADMAPITIMGHKAYGVFIAPGMGLRQNDPRGTAVDDQAEGQYWVINGLHFNSGCCFDYGNAEIDSRDDDNGTMETTYFGNATPWYHGVPPGPWIMTDQENNLVGCVNPDGSKYCANVPTVTSRFVTAMAKGEAHHWTTLGGDAQHGALSVLFDGPRIDSTYDPMRKQGAILLGNGGDNSNSSQGTFYEGAMTASGTFPTNETDQQVQANVVAARYGVPLLSIAPTSAAAAPPGLQTFSLGSAQETTVTFTNSTEAPATDIKLNLSLPAKWAATVQETTENWETFPGPVAPGASVSATFKVTAGPTAFNGDLIANASWTNAGGNGSARTTEKVRSGSPVKINEFRVSSGSPTNSTNSFIELYNAGDREVDLGNWSLTEHPTQQAIFSSVKIPAGTRLAPQGFYVLGLSDSGLEAPAAHGDSTIFVRSTTGIAEGDTINIGTGAEAESRKVVGVGTPASYATVWQPVPDGPIVSFPAGSTNLPVTSTSGFTVGEKVALGYGATFPTVGKSLEHYEVATVTSVGKPGTQAYLAADAAVGVTNVKVTSTSNISVGDKIRLDIDSSGHGIETVTVARVGTQASRTNLTADAAAGATNLKVRSVTGFATGDKLTVGTPANHEEVSITKVGTSGATGTGIEVAPALTRPHTDREGLVVPGTGIDLAAPLRFAHAANLPFSDRGTGIDFQPAARFAHASNEPVTALGSGIKLDSPIQRSHATDEVVRDPSVTTAGYQSSPTPNQWFGGPVLFNNNVTFGGRSMPVSAGSMVLRDGSGIVIDSLNYGLIVDPWAAEGYHAVSGSEQSGCRVAAPGSSVSAGRFPDGTDTDSNCNDFLSEPSSTLSADVAAAGTNVKIVSAGGFAAGQTIGIDTGANLEKAVIASVGTSGATTTSAATDANATVIPVAGTLGFHSGQSIIIASGENQEERVVVSVNRASGTIAVTSPLIHAHPAGVQVAGTGITLASGLAKPHASGAQITGSIATPGAPNQYFSKR